MQIPKTPPDFKHLLQNIAPERFATVLGAVRPLEEYWHWDEIRHRTPPTGLSHQEWWLGLKLGRVAQYRHLPLLDTKNQPFRYFTTDPILAFLHDVDLRAGGSVGMGEQVPNHETRNQYHVSSLMEEAITSSQLEGAATTREVARDMLRTGRPPRDVSERMILNNYLTMRRLSEWRNKPLTQELVFEIHRLITQQTLDDESAAGRFRRKNETICVEDETGEILHVPPPASELAERMTRMCDFANAPDGEQPFLHPVMRAIILHFWLAYDHPFKDGNGRTARALFYWLMLRREFWLFEFVSISQILRKSQVQYARSYLHTETDDNDLNYFILHQLKVIRLAVDALHDYIKRKTSETRQLSSALRGRDDINYRQEAILNRAIRHPGTVFTTESHRTSHDISYFTARADLLGLEKLGFLQKRKRGKGFVFEAATDLTARLKGMSKP